MPKQHHRTGHLLKLPQRTGNGVFNTRVAEIGVQVFLDTTQITERLGDKCGHRQPLLRGAREGS